MPSKSLVQIKTKVKLLAVDDVAYAIDEARKAHLESSIVNLIGKVTNELGQKGADTDKIIGMLSSGITSIQNEVAGEHPELDLATDWESVYEHVRDTAARTKAAGLAGVPTGFKTLDEVTGGIQAGELWVVAARLGQGKTWTLLRMAATALCSGARVQFDAMEQSRMQIALRIHTLLSGDHGKTVFGAADLRTGGNINLIQYKKFVRDQLPKMVNGTGALLINDTSRGRVTPASVAAQIERNNPTVVYLDYITLMASNESGGKAGAREQWQQIASISAELKGIALQYEVGIVAAAQINRMGIGREVPDVSALSGSDAIGHDADAVITMRRESDRVMKMKLAKYRHGQDKQQWYCSFKTNSGVYQEIDKDVALDMINEDAVADA